MSKSMFEVEQSSEVQIRLRNGHEKLTIGCLPELTSAPSIPSSSEVPEAIFSVSILAKKHNLHVNYILNRYKSIRDLGIILYSSDTKKEGVCKSLDDDTMLQIYNSNEKIGSLNVKGKSCFQRKSCSDLIFENIRSDESKKSIINKNPYKDRYNNNNDCCIHVRLGDVRSWNPGVLYFCKVLDDLNFDKLYIASDSPNDHIVKEIKNKYENSEILIKNEIETIQFASTCKNVVLSHGT